MHGEFGALEEWPGVDKIELASVGDNLEGWAIVECAFGVEE